MSYTIERRYECYARNGKTWCNWFDYEHLKTKKEAEERLSVLKSTGELNKKLKGEYRIKKEE